MSPVPPGHGEINVDLVTGPDGNVYSLSLGPVTKLGLDGGRRVDMPRDVTGERFHVAALGPDGRWWLVREAGERGGSVLLVARLR